MLRYHCMKCNTDSRVVKDGRDLHCEHCGNVNVEGVKPRWPIIEQTYIPPTMSGPKIVEGGGMKKSEEQGDMKGPDEDIPDADIPDLDLGTKRPYAKKNLCSNCKTALSIAKHLCWKCFKLKYGCTYKEYRERGKGNVMEDRIAPVSYDDSLVHDDPPDPIGERMHITIDFTDYPELYAKANEKAKAGYRTLTEFCLYAIDAATKADVD